MDQSHSDDCFVVPKLPLTVGRRGSRVQARSRTRSATNISSKINSEISNRLRVPPPSPVHGGANFNVRETNLHYFESSPTSNEMQTFVASPQLTIVQSPHISQIQHKLSAELSKLCSDTECPSWSAFDSDSDNSSNLFADDSFLSSADFVDSVFAENEIFQASLDNSGWKSDAKIKQTDVAFLVKHWQSDSPPASFQLNDKCPDSGGQSEVKENFTPASVGSRNSRKNARLIRRVKSTSSHRSVRRFSPITSKTSQHHSVSEIRWYKAKTDTSLYEIRKNYYRVISLSKDASTISPSSLKKLDEKLIERTETPESGYFSVDTTRRTPDLSEASPAQSQSPSNARVLDQKSTPAGPSSASSANHLHDLLCFKSLLSFQRLDFMSKLFRVERNLVDQILKYLEPNDLVLFSSVSQGWRDICSSCVLAASRRDVYLEEKKLIYQRAKENRPLRCSTPRQMTGPGTPLSAIQQLGKPRAESTPVRPVTVSDKFLEAGQQLKKGQSLAKCKCGSPAQIDDKSNRALCNSMHCGFEFCTKCRMSYHGNHPCSSTPSGSRRTRVPSVGSRKSKNSLRRNSRLSSTDR